jgi:hypothetical protein
MLPKAPMTAPADGRDAARIFALFIVVLFVGIMVLSAITS